MASDFEDLHEFLDALDAVVTKDDVVCFECDTVEQEVGDVLVAFGKWNEWIDREHAVECADQDSGRCVLPPHCFALRSIPGDGSICVLCACEVSGFESVESDLYAAGFCGWVSCRVDLDDLGWTDGSAGVLSVCGSRAENCEKCCGKFGFHL